MSKAYNWSRTGVYVLGVASLGGAILYAFLPRTVLVEVKRVSKGPLQTTVDEDGKTRIKEKYVVSSPLAGRLSRVQLHPGDVVEAGKTILTTLYPTAPTLLDARSRAEAEARLKAAEAARRRTEPAVASARAGARFAAEEFARAKQLEPRGGLPHEEVDRAELRLTAAQEDLKSAEFSLQVAEHELELARAAMIHSQRNGDEQDPEAWSIPIRSPIDGAVLRVFQESSSVVAAGTALIEVGDPQDLEVVVDVLSSDAVKISPGNDVQLADWGGDQPLHGRVRLVEPSGFTKISALGVEEQRVNVIIDIVEDPARRTTLGDDFRVEASILVDQVESAIKVPNGALFRQGTEQATFVVANGRASLRFLKIGRRGRLESEVTSGLQVGEDVAIYPSDRLRDGAAVRVRPE